jgi:hypothetical protein
MHLTYRDTSHSVGADIANVEVTEEMVSYVASELLRFSRDGEETEREAAERIIRYLIGRIRGR